MVVSLRGRFGYITRLMFALAIFLQASFGQTSARVIDWHPGSGSGYFTADENKRLIPTSDGGIELVSASVKGEVIELGKPFAAADDWLKGLAIKVKNVSGRAIKSIRVNFNLPEAKFKEGTMGFSLEYGKELSTGITYGEQKLVLPGEEITLIRSEQHYTRDRDGIMNRTGVLDFNRTFIGMATVVFEDGKTWFCSKIPFTSDRK